MLTGVNLFVFMDRKIIAVVVEPIKQELGVSDAMMGAMIGLAFSLTYSIFGFPMARLADRGLRVRVMTLALAFWSAMTVVSGLVVSATQMFLARLGVGVGESGGQPPAQALVAEYFPLESRTFALSIFVVGAYLGSSVGSSLGGYLGETYSWRHAFYVLGFPGILFALLVGLTVREPASKPRPPETDSRNTLQAAVDLLRRPAFRNLMLGAGILYFSSQGAASWHPTFFLRTHGLSLAQSGNLEALMTFLPVVAILVMGYVTNLLYVRNPIWLMRIPMLSAAAGVPFFLMLYLAPTWQLASIGYAIAQILIGVYSGLFLSTMQALVWPHERALAAAVLMFCSVLVGLGLGPLVVGLISDLLRPTYGQDSLRWALVICKIVPVWGVFHLWLASRTFLEEIKGEAPRPSSAH